MMNASSTSLQKLLTALRDGDTAAAGALLQRYQPWLELLARIQMDSRFQGKFSHSDVVQQTQLEAFRALPQFRGDSEGELLAWLRQILAHVLSHEFRRYRGTQQRDLTREISLEAALEQSSQRIHDFLAASGSTPSHQAVRHEEELQLAEILARLPEEYREIIILRNIEGLSHEESAARMKRSVGATRMLWVRALSKLKAAFGN